MKSTLLPALLALTFSFAQGQDAPPKKMKILVHIACGPNDPTRAASANTSTLLKHEVAFAALSPARAIPLAGEEQAQFERRVQALFGLILPKR